MHRFELNPFVAHLGVLALCVCVGLAGCGGGGGDQSPLVKEGKSPAPAPQQQLQAQAQPSNCPQAPDAAAMLALINQTRARTDVVCNGVPMPAVPALEWNESLAKAAVAHAMDMAQRNYFNHNALPPAPYGVSPWDRISHFGFKGSPSGEIIAAGNSTAQASINQWLRSTSGHCEALMGAGQRYTGMGCGYNASATYKYYWTQVFATSKAS